MRLSCVLGALRRKLRLLCSRLKWLLRKRPRPKVVIKRLGKQNWSFPHKGGLETRAPSFRLNSDRKRPICIATFNVAMFSLAPAIRAADDLAFLDYADDDPVSETVQGMTGLWADKMPCTPKSILKQSPLHSTPSSPDMLSNQTKLTKPKPKVSINLPDNEISLAHSKFLSIVESDRDGSSNLITGKDHLGSVSMRSPVCLPSSLMAWWSQESVINSGRSMAELLREVDADILALQDVKAEEARGMKPLSDLASALGMKYVFGESWAPEYGNAILSKWPIKKWKVQRIADDYDFRNVLKATIDVPWAGEVNFYCTQLDHLNERWRMNQISAIIQADDSPHVLLGGLNSLDGSDYSAERWKDIVKYYEDIGKPTPRVEVMRFLKGRGYSDAKDFAGECEPVVIIAKGQNVQGTCKYGTRVDYILASPNSSFNFVPGSYSVASSKGTSDHHIVKAEIVKSDDRSRGRFRRRHQKAQRVVKITNPSTSTGIWKITS